MKFWKILTEAERHNGLQFRDGLNVDTQPFLDESHGTCVAGGIYFSPSSSILFYAYVGPWIREVTIPEDARVCRDPGIGSEKWRADRVILGPRRTLAEAIDELILDGAEVNAKANDGWPPLHAAAVCGYTAEAKLLLAAGADVNAKDSRGWTPLHYAARGRTVAAKLLLAAGAEVNAKANDGWTPLHEAAVCGYTAEAVELLLAAGADVNAKDSYGWTPLHYAARGRTVAAVKLLLAAGADPNAKDNYSWTPLHEAAAYGYTAAVADLLRENGGVE